MPQAQPKVCCQTPTPGKSSTNIDQWKYDAVRAAIRKAVPRNKLGLEFRALPAAVKAHLSPDHLARLGSVSWYTTTVKLDLEVRGELERVPGSRPQRLRRVK